MQQSLRLDANHQLNTLWAQVPEHCRSELIEQFARLMERHAKAVAIETRKEPSDEQSKV
jgi:acyl-CoA reductase-like NAD-dependent aldehyde dehydrogenase